MKATVSSDYIKEMKASIKVVNESMKRIAEAEIMIMQTENPSAPTLI